MKPKDFMVFYKKGIKRDVLDGKRVLIHSTLYLAIPKGIPLQTALKSLLGEDNAKAILAEAGCNIMEWDRVDTYGMVVDYDDLPKEVKEILESSQKVEFLSQGVIPIIVIDKIEPVDSVIPHAPFPS